MTLRSIHQRVAQRPSLAGTSLGYALQAIFCDRTAVAYEALLRSPTASTQEVLSRLLSPPARPHFTAYTLRWAAAALRDRPDLPGIAVNLSPDQLLDDLALEVLGWCGSSVLARLEVEITEQTVPDAGRLADRVRALDALGVRVHLDDVVPERWPDLDADLPLTGVKLDLAYVRRLADDPCARREAAVRIGELRTAGLDVTAEGIASHAHACALRDLGCNRFQGFGLALPTPLD